MFKNKTTDESSILKFGSLICLLLFVFAGNELIEFSLEVRAIVVGFGVFSSSLLFWMSGKV